MRDHSLEGGQRDLELGYSENRVSTDRFQKEAQQKGLTTDSADFAYTNAADAGREAATGSSASSLHVPGSLPESLRGFNIDVSDIFHGLPPGDSDPDTRHPSQAAGVTAGVRTKASHPQGAPRPVRRVTKVHLEPDTAGTSTALNGLSLLNDETMGIWLVEHHRDQLLREIRNDSVGGFPLKHFKTGSTKKSKPRGEEPRGEEAEQKESQREEPQYEEPEQNKANGEESVAKDHHSNQSGVPPRYRVSFAELQRMHLRKLQIKLVKHAVLMYKDGREAENSTWEKDLAEYVQGLKDYDYMTECSKLPPDFFLATGERNVDRYVIDTVIQHTGKDAEKLRAKPMEMTSRVEPITNDSIPIGGTRGEKTSVKRARDFRDRLILAAIGAILLLGPMWLMVLHNTLYTGLVTTTVCVAVFGLVASWRLDKPNDVLSATAAYAAVLVVFVGLTNTD